MAKKKEPQKPPEARPTEATPPPGASFPPSGGTEGGPGGLGVRIRTAVYQGQRLSQRRRAGLVAFGEWSEHAVTPEQLALLQGDSYLEVEL